jgi:hypothetical protein
MERQAQRARNLFFSPGGTNDPSGRSTRRESGGLTMLKTTPTPNGHTEALRRVLAEPLDGLARADYLFLEAWERDPSPNAGTTLRIGQIRRANPVLAAEIRAELKNGRPLTQSERARL